LTGPGGRAIRRWLLALLFVARDGEKAVPEELLSELVPGPFGVGF
jgi:hypothetical protein